MIDFHCHLDLYAQPERVAQRIQDANVGALSVTTTPAAWVGTRRLSEGRPTIRTALGLHPELAALRKSELGLFGDLLAETDFVGEIGLDGSPPLKGTQSDQLTVFSEILRLCTRAGGKLLSIHSRGAAIEVLEALRQYPDAGIPVFHWLSSTQAILKDAIRSGCWFSVGPGMLAGARGQSLARLMPRDRVVLESDGPFAQVQGKPAGPWSLTATASQLGELWGMRRSEIFDVVRDNEAALLAAVSSYPIHPLN